MRRAVFFGTLFLLLIPLACEEELYYPLSRYSSPFDISFEVTIEGVVDATISNCHMKPIRTLIDSEYMECGVHTVQWDLLDDHGDYSGDGIYEIEVLLDGDRVYYQVVEVVK